MQRLTVRVAAALGFAAALVAAPGVAWADATVFATTAVPGGSAVIDAGCGADATAASVSGTSWGGPSEVYVFGAVHVDGSPETYLEAARDIGRLGGTPGYQGAGEIRDDATVADLGALAFDPDDVKALKTCREGSCDVQLPTSGIQRFREGVDWSRPDAADQAGFANRGRTE